MPELTSRQPEYRNIHAFQDLPTYRLPAAGWVSILHRISGALLFLFLPFIIWLFDITVSSELSFETFSTVFEVGLHHIPSILFKSLALLLIWAYLHHLIAGIRHLYMDSFHAVSLPFGRLSARVTLVSSVGLTLALGAKLFGFY